METTKLIDEVVAGESVEDVLEKAITRAGYDPRSGQNKQTTVWAENGEEDEDDDDQNEAETHDTDRQYPLAGTRKFPRGSHEALPPEGEPPRVREPSVTAESLIESVVEGMRPRDLVNVQTLNEAAQKHPQAKKLRSLMTKFETIAGEFEMELGTLKDAHDTGKKISKLLRPVTRRLDLGKMNQNQLSKLEDQFNDIAGDLASAPGLGRLSTDVKRLMQQMDKMGKLADQIADILSDTPVD